MNKIKRAARGVLLVGSLAGCASSAEVREGGAGVEDTSTLESELVVPGATCSDGAQNNGETGVDCGGPSCQLCEATACQSLPLRALSASASSQESAALAAPNSADFDSATRWASAFSDNQWLVLDLGQQRYIDRVRLSWEAAASRSYDLQLSSDGTSWTTVYTDNAGNGGTDEITGLKAKARYVRMISRTRTTGYGVSLWEMVVFGDADPACSPAAFELRSAHSGKALDVVGVSRLDGAKIQQWGYGGGDNQKWKLLHQGAGTYEIRSVLSDKCLDVPESSTSNGVTLQQWACTGGSNQRFKFANAGNGQYRVIAQHSHKCLDVADWSSADGGRIQQWDCGSGSNQRWALSNRSASAPEVPSRKWALSDPNDNGVWNYSSTWQGGKTTIEVGNEWGDVPYAFNQLRLAFNHPDGLGYAGANITTGSDGAGTEPTSAAERDAAKAVNANGYLRFLVAQSMRFGLRVKLLGQGGTESSDVKIDEHLVNCGIGSCEAFIPVSLFARAGFDFSRVTSVTFFIDSRAAAGAYSAGIEQLHFAANTLSTVDTYSDPENCGRIGHSCLGGSCVAGACRASLVTNDLRCSSSFAASEDYLYVGDQGTVQRFDWAGRNKTALYAGDYNALYISDMVRDGSDLFWRSASGLQRLSDGASSPVTLHSDQFWQMTLSNGRFFAYDSNDSQNSRYVSFDRNGSGVSTVVSLGAQHGSVSAVTSGHLYYVENRFDVATNQSYSVLWQVPRSGGTPRQVNAFGETIFGIAAYGDTVYWNHTTGQQTSGISKLSSAPGASVQPAVSVEAGHGVGVPFVDESGIYHSYHDGLNHDFWRTSLTNPSERVLVTKGYSFPMNGTNVQLVSNAIVWLATCSRGSGGSVQRLAKP